MRGTSTTSWPLANFPGFTRANNATNAMPLNCRADSIAHSPALRRGKTQKSAWLPTASRLLS